MPRVLCGLVALATPLASQSAAEPLGDEIARLQSFLATTASADENFAAVKPGAEAELALAATALQRGRRLAALYRLERVRAIVRGVAYQLEAMARGAADFAALDREWERVGAAIGAADGNDPGAAANAAVQALVEAAEPQIRGLHVASRDYGRATLVAAGLFYLGAALAEREFVAFARQLPDRAAGRPLSLRALRADIDALNRELLAAYRPPQSLERHGEFVAAHSALAEARDLDAAGNRHGALLRYVQAAFRSAAVRAPGAAPAREQVVARLAAAKTQIAADGCDHAIATMLVEIAEAELESAAEGVPAPTAQAIATAGLPHYFAALAPATAESAAAPPPAPELVVTLVRWPYA